VPKENKKDTFLIDPKKGLSYTGSDMKHKQKKSAPKALLDHPAVQQVHAVIARTPLPPVYLVGGALRDSWLERAVIDFDFVVDGNVLEWGPIIAEQLDARLLLLDEEWGVVRLILPAGGPAGLQNILDLTSLRGGSIQEDLRLRDFTINAMAIKLTEDPMKADLLLEDPYGGLNDLAAGLVRMIHPDRFQEDPLRILRAFRLACSLQFSIESSTLETIRSARNRLLSPASERIRDEIYKILSCPKSCDTLRKMDQSGILEILFPHLNLLKNLLQGKYHHLDGWEHSLETCRIIEEGINTRFSRAALPEELKQAWIIELEENKSMSKPSIMLGALLHDIGKTGTGKTDSDGEIHFYGHARSGADIAGDTLKGLRASKKDQERIKRYIQYHMGPLQLQHAREEDRLRERTVIRFLNRLGEDVLGLLLIAWADREASRGGAASPQNKEAFKEVLASLFFFHNRQEDLDAKVGPLVTGKDLIEELGLAPGPMIGRLLRLIKEEWMLGHIHTRAEAVNYAAEWIKSHI